MDTELAVQVSVLSAHVKYGSREAVIDALVHLGVRRGAPLPVWPPRKLPGALWAWVFVSPERNGWVSLWGPPETTRDWFPTLMASLECPGVLLEVIQSQFWIAEFF